MKTIEKYNQICDNYFNGNLEDFRKDLSRLTKKEILVLEYILSEYFNPVDMKKANNTIHKYL